MCIRKFEGLELAHGVAAIEGDGPAFFLGGADHPVEKIDFAGAFHCEVDGASLGYGRRSAGGVGDLGEAEAAIEDIGFLAVDR